VDVALVANRYQTFGALNVLDDFAGVVDPVPSAPKSTMSVEVANKSDMHTFSVITRMFYDVYSA
jgi:hypothetical protein